MKQCKKDLRVKMHSAGLKKIPQAGWSKHAFLGVLSASIVLLSQMAYGGDGMATAAIEAGPLNSVVVKNDGTVWAWGRNAYGESGNTLVGSTSITNPVLTSLTLTNAVAVASGGLDSTPYYAHTLVLRSDGLVLASGTNNFGQLGDGSTQTKTNFVVVTNLANIVAIAAGSYHSLALKADGTVWGWGNNTSGQIGNGTSISPQLTPLQTTNLADVIAIASGQNHSLALKADGTVWAWGTNSCGQLGDGTTTSRLAPVMVTNLNNIVAISAGANFSLALKGDGTAWAWGTNGVGQIGIGNTTTPQKTPVQVTNLRNAVAISSGAFASMALESDGTVWCWGANDHGQIGNGISAASQTTPVMVTNLTGVLSIAAGGHHSLALLADGSLAAWGDNTNYQVSSSAPKLSIISNSTAVQGVAGVGLAVENHSLSVKLDGTVWAFGYNILGQIGDGTTVNRSQPVGVNNQYETIAASAGAGHSIALKLDDSVWAWGGNNYGQLGDGTTINRATPVTVTNLGGIEMIVAGGLHSLALSTNGTVWAWGCNSYGQLGDGTITNHQVPVLVTNLSNVSAIAAGKQHSLALLNNGTVSAWGGNSSGQIGDSTITNRLIPVLVTNLSNVLAIAAGGQHSLALLTNGTVWAWGNNTCGQLGNNSVINTNVPVQVTNLNGIMAIAAGGRFSAALSTNGALWVWGCNAYGQMGDGSTTNHWIPVQVSWVSGAKAIQAGENHLIITMGDGTLNMLGANLSGQLGNGTTANQLNTAQVPNFSLIQPNYAAMIPNNPDYSGLGINLYYTNRFLYRRGSLPGWVDSISLVAPLNFQIGIVLNPTGDNTNYFAGAKPWFSQIARDTRFHVHIDDFNTSQYDYTVVPAFNNPIVAFGAAEGGTPLYVGQSYHFGIFPGHRIEDVAHPEFTNTIRILVYARTNFIAGKTNISPIATNDIYIPRKTISADLASWNQFASNGFTATIQAYGLKTTVYLYEPNYNNLSDYGAGIWVQYTNAFGSAGEEQYILTHTASDDAKNYYYRIEALGACTTYSNWVYMVTNSIGGYSRDILYTLDFVEHPFWRSPFVDQPQYENTPKPSFYLGQSTQELTNSPTVISYPLSLSGNCTNIDTSPELRRHPVLDQFVRDMGNDPIGLARYVINEISLSDYMACGPSNVPYASINLGGIKRGALGTFLEKQGSPAEQCALLVYLLRQAGFKAAYMYPTNNNLLMLDAHLDKLMRMKIKGAENLSLYTTNQYIVVNYPWVVANIGTNTVHIFPWLKDTEITEGLDLYDYMPANYNNALKWVRDYVYGKTNIISSNYSDNTPSILFPKFIKNNLLANYPGVSLDDIGVQIVNRRHEYAQWTDFPAPDVATNIGQAALVQDFASITNAGSNFTNYFDTVRVDVVSGSNPNTVLLSSGDMQMSDIHNRRFIEATNNSRIYLWMEPYRTNAAGLGNFGSYLTNNYLSAQSNSVALGGNTSFKINIIYSQHRFSYYPNGYLGITEYGPIVHNTVGYGPIITNNSTGLIYPQDVVGICITPGRVTADMLNPHMQDFWQMETKRNQNTNYVPPVVDYQGASAYLMGMYYWERYCCWDNLNKRLHKIGGLNISKLLSGTAKIARASTVTVQPGLDMVRSPLATVANGTLHTDADIDPYIAMNDYGWMDVAGASAEEHQTINQLFKITNSISSVVLLQMAQNYSGPSKAGIVELNKYSYQALGNTTSTGYGASLLKSYDVWSNVTNLFVSAFGEAGYAFITPGLQTNADKSYYGMGLLASSPYINFETVSGGQNGGWGTFMGDIGNWDLYVGSYLFPLTDTGTPSGYDWIIPDSTTPIMLGLTPAISSNPNQFLPEQLGFWGLANNYDANLFNSIQLSEAGAINSVYQLGSVSVGDSFSTANNSGFLGQSSFLSTAGSFVYDPVSPITGEFCINSVDLALPGPMPLEIKRNYSSQNQANNQFGYGWKMNYMPYLVLTTNNSTMLMVIYEAEPDGSVVAFRQTTNNSTLFKPVSADNPQLDNYSRNGIGTTANLFNSSITNFSVGTNQFYDLLGADGSVRIFQVQSFPISNATNTVSRLRPYLTKWQDAQGNYYTFAYGTDSTQSDYGQVRRIQSSNGNFLGFYYDVYQHIIEAYTGDGRRLYYGYDSHGDLINVTLPDASQIQYVYQDTTTSTNTYSTHLITEEIKPDGRSLENIYDNTNRVMAQLSTVGQDLNLYTNAQFCYSNNFTVNATNGISGYTLITDINNNVSRYEYTNGLITKITDPLNQTVIQSWYWTNDGNGGYQRSLQQRTDKRGLVTQYYYDSKGNILTNITSGTDLTGDGKTASTNYFAYNSNNLPVLAIDAIGNQTKYTFTNTTFPYLPTSVERYASNGASISVNALYYGCASNIVVNGYVTTTNQAFGILTRAIRAIGSGDAATNDLFYDGRGFIISEIKYTGTTDPNVTNSFLYNNLGELVQQTDAAGRISTYDYDGMGRLTSKQVFDTGSLTPMYWENSYYNENGELIWRDGPRYNPEDYVWRDYDGAGRKTQEIHWRSRAKADGSGVEAETGDNLYATTFYQYDGFGNMVKAGDQFGNYTRMAYDPIGQLIDKRSYAPNQAAPLTVEKYAYEPGGQVSIYTNALSGVTFKYYTTTGKLKQQTNSDGSALQYTYYLDGRPRREYLPNGNYYETTYDDANRLVKRTFSGDASYLETKMFDRRGNLIITTNAVGAVFMTAYDDLDRVKQSVGPAATSSSAQQINTCAYDASGKQLITTNALGEFTIANHDALGRVITNSVYDAQGNRISISTTTYSPDFNSVTTTAGSGANVISNTIFTDTYGKTVLTQRFPTKGLVVFALNSYDVTEHLVVSQDELKQTTSYAYDNLYRLATQVLPDGATTSFGYNAMGSMTNRAMPGGLIWSATYDSANRMLSEQLKGGSSTDRQFTYQYYTSGPDAGLLQTKTDVGRNVTDTTIYDSCLRLATNATSGSLPDQNLTCIYQYDQRGLTTNLTQVGFTTSDVVQRTYDGYGQMTEEKATINGIQQSDFTQNWNAAGRRSQLAQSGSPTYGSFNYGYRADGLMTNVNQGGNNFGFGYGDNGLLALRSNPWRTLTVNQRDGQGRLLQETATVGVSNVLVEALTWRTNFEISSYAATRIGAGAWNDSRVYQYNSRNQLMKEPLGITNNILATNSYAFDANKLGVLTGARWSGGLSNGWQATVMDSLAQITAESWNESSLTLRAGGSAVNASSVAAKLDGSAVGSTLANGRWYSDLTLAPGSHTLAATASYSVGQYAATATSAFSLVGTNNALNYYDAAGNVTNRVFASGKTQALIWDGWGRLVGVVEQDTPTNGFNWTAVYDGLGRRLRTTQTPVVNGVANTAVTLTLDSYFDPLVEFEELGVAVNGTRTWKVMGPDLNGRYGGMQGLGGLEATVRESDGTVTPVLDDYFGNVLATIAGTAVNWNPVRVSGYGPVLGYQSPTLTASTPLAETLLWRSHRIDPSGFYYLGARYYDPLAGHFLSPDPLGHAASMDLYSAFNGDPVNYFDADGRLGKNSAVSQVNLGGENLVSTVTSPNVGPAWTFFNANASQNNLFGNNFFGTTVPADGASVSPTGASSLFGTAATALNTAGIGQFGAEYGFGKAVLGLYNSSATSSGLYFNSSFWGGNGYVDTMTISDIAHGFGYVLFGASAGLELYGVGTGQETPLEASRQIDAGFIGLLGGPLGAAVGVTYGFFHNDINEAAEGTFQIFTDSYYGNNQNVKPIFPNGISLFGNDYSNGNLFFNSGNNSNSSSK